MSIKNLTFDSAVLKQAEGQWQKLLTIVLWKLQGRTPVQITPADLQRFSAEFEPGMPSLYMHGLGDIIHFQVVDEMQARHLAAHEASMKGHA